MKRVLVIAYFYPPIANSGTQRPLKFANHLPEAGWTPVVLTVGDPPDAAIDPRLLSEVRQGTEVHRVPLASDRLATRIARVAGPWRDRIAEALEWRLRRLQTFPDLYASWGRTAIEAGLALHAATPFDAFFATGFPWTDFLVGRALSRRTGRPWVADFRDAWTGDDVFAAGDSRRRRLRGQRLEQQLLRDADRVTAVTPQLAEHLRTIGGPGCAPVHVIPNGYDAEDLRHADDVARPEPGRIRVVYVGVFKVGYGPTLLYDAAQRLSQGEPEIARRIEIVTAGFPAGEATRRGVGAMVQELGPVSHAHALGLMRSADLLFLPIAGGIHQRVQVPGKLYEYMASLTHVVAAVEPGGAAASLIEETACGTVIAPNDLDGLTAILRDAAQRGRVAALGADPARIQRFERRALAAQLAAVLDLAVRET